MHYEILDEKRKAILPLFFDFRKDGFYLAGGTGLALLIGHRDSLDFDFFTEKDFDTENLFKSVVSKFGGHKVIQTQAEKNTLSVLVDDRIKVSFFTYKYPLLQKTVSADFFEIAGVDDIACMKINAIVNRSTLKDYVDLYFILKQKELSDILADLKIKMPGLDTLLALKSIIYFEGIDPAEPIIFKTDKVSFEEIKSFLLKEVKKISEN